MKSKILNICIIGNTNSGKSTFLNSIIGKEISISNKKRNTTIDSVIGIINDKNLQMIFHDTPGMIFSKSEIPKKKEIKKNFWNSLLISDVILYFLDSTKNNIFLNSDILKQLKKNKKNIFIILNKIDLIEKNLILPLIYKIFNQYKFEDIYPISAKQKIGLNEIINNLKKLSIKGKWQYEKNQVTDKDNSFISEEITRNSLLRNLNNEIPYSVKIINYKWKLLRNNIIIINQNILINKLNYKKIIIGKNGTMIEKIRKFSEKKLTKVFQKKVFLHLKIIFEK